MATLRKGAASASQPPVKSDPLLTPPTSDQSDDDDAQATKDQKARAQRRQGAVPASAAEDAVDYADSDIPDDYVTRTLQSQPPLPPIQWKNILSEIQWVSFIVLTTTPLLAIYGMFTTQLQLKTFIWAVVYYFITGLGITAGEFNRWSLEGRGSWVGRRYFGGGSFAQRGNFQGRKSE